MNERYSETISEQLKKRARPEKEISHCRSSDYAVPTPLTRKPIFTPIRQLDQFPSRKGSQHHSSSTIETPDTQSSQENHNNVTQISNRFYRPVTYNE